MIESKKGRLIYKTNNEEGLLFEHLTFYIVDMKKGSKKELIAKLPVNGIIGLLSYCRLATRLLRLEPKCTGLIDGNRYVVCILGKLWILDIQNKTINSIAVMRTGYSVLNFCERDGIVYWGDYGSNSDYNEINIYKLGKELIIRKAYVFPENSVRHIHNIINTNDGFIVFAGDNESAAGIYKANADWSNVKPWKIGEQKYRAVVGFPYKGGLLYATDSVETENHLRLIEEDGTEQILSTINGSCIYGGETKEYYLFSTTVESHEGGGIRRLLSNQLGGGIKSRDVHIILVNKKDLTIRILKKYRKDKWAMKLFQYGTSIFPRGQENDENGVWCYIMSCKKYDGKSEYIRYNE